MSVSIQIISRRLWVIIFSGLFWFWFLRQARPGKCISRGFRRVRFLRNRFEVVDNNMSSHASIDIHSLVWCGYHRSFVQQWYGYHYGTHSLVAYRCPWHKARRHGGVTNRRLSLVLPTLNTVIWAYKWLAYCYANVARLSAQGSSWRGRPSLV